VPALLLKLLGVYPNPFSDYCHITYWLSRDADIEIRIWDVSGELVVVRSKIQGIKGNNYFLWDRKNRRDLEAASGVFIYRILATTQEGESASAMDKLAIVK
jgi:hypothetical protein